MWKKTGFSTAFHRAKSGKILSSKIMPKINFHRLFHRFSTKNHYFSTNFLLQCG
jgi:hypothetical protein